MGERSGRMTSSTGHSSRRAGRGALPQPVRSTGRPGCSAMPHVADPIGGECGRWGQATRPVSAGAASPRSTEQVEGSQASGRLSTHIWTYSALPIATTRRPGLRGTEGNMAAPGVLALAYACLNVVSASAIVFANKAGERGPGGSGTERLARTRLGPRHGPAPRAPASQQ